MSIKIVGLIVILKTEHRHKYKVNNEIKESVRNNSYMFNINDVAGFENNTIHFIRNSGLESVSATEEDLNIIKEAYVKENNERGVVNVLCEE